jgi:hypothetical protein
MLPLLLLLLLLLLRNVFRVRCVDVFGVLENINVMIAFQIA